MADLKAMCESAGFGCVKTYIASGNVLFTSNKSKAVVRKTLAAQLQTYAGKPVGVLVRTPNELKSILENNPYSDAEPSKTAVLFLEKKATPSDLSDCTSIKNEELSIGKNELYVYYPEGMGATKIKIPIASTGTARNINTVNKLVALANAL